MCVMQGRFREGDPATGCMALMMDGRELSQAQAETIAPERLAAVVVLTRREATRLLGSLGRRGAVLLYPPGGSPGSVAGERSVEGFHGEHDVGLGKVDVEFTGGGRDLDEIQSEQRQRLK